MDAQHIILFRLFLIRNSDTIKGNIKIFMYAWHEYQIFILSYADIKIKNENWIDDIDNDKAKTTDQPTRQDMIFKKT